jgi:hypothetical protein
LAIAGYAVVVPLLVLIFSAIQEAALVMWSLDSNPSEGTQSESTETLHSIVRGFPLNLTLERYVLNVEIQSGAGWGTLNFQHRTFNFQPAGHKRLAPTGPASYNGHTDFGHNSARSTRVGRHGR